MKILVCGGAGYVGSHIAMYLKEHQHEVVVYDNLSTGHASTVKAMELELVVGDVRDVELLKKTMETHRPEAVMHFCADSIVPFSVKDPIKYYDNNVCGAIQLLKVMHECNVKYLVFSSTCAIFGSPAKMPIEEDDPKDPINPYGNTKLAVEQFLKWVDGAYGIRSACLRYFNASGAHKSGIIGEIHDPETHLIPLVLQVATGRREFIYQYGDDYPTPDGTCVRDYVHVSDLASAHLKALEYIMKNDKSENFNLGSGIGYSVKQIIECSRRITGHPIPVKMAPRREGDPPELYAKPIKARGLLGWNPEASLDDIIRTAYEFHMRNEGKAN